MKNVAFRILAATLLIFLPYTLKAQESLPLYRHEFRFGVGTPVFGQHFYEQSGFLLSDGNNQNNNYYNISSLPNFNLTYTYQLFKWMSIGFTASYLYSNEKSYELYNNNQVYNNDINTISLLPMVRFNWLRHGMANLYSSIGLGIQYCHTQTDRDYNTNIKNSSYYFAYDITAFGLSIGKRLFGFCEIGMSNIGCVKAGLGYRVNTNN